MPGAWILFYSFLHLLHQSLLIEGSLGALISVPENAGTDIKGQSRLATHPNHMKISSVSHIDKYKWSGGGMQ